MYFDCDTKMGLCFRSAGLLCTSFSAMAVGRQSPGSTILTIVLPGDCRPTAIALKLVQSKPALRKHRPIFVSQSKYIPRMVKVFNAGAYRNQPEFTSGCDARLGFPLANQTRGNQPVLAKMSAGHATCSVPRRKATKSEARSGSNCGQAEKRCCTCSSHGTNNGCGAAFELPGYP